MATLLNYALTSVSDVKESLGISSGDNSQNNLIIRKINQATEMIEKFCNVRFKLTQYTNEEYDATRTDQMVLKMRPIVIDDTHAFTFQVRETPLNESDWETVDTDLYFVDKGAGVVDLLFTALGKWNRYRFTYYAGYETIPSDIQEACASLASYYVNNPTSGGAIKRKREGQREIEYFDANVNSTNIFEQLGIDEILKSYASNPILEDK